MVKHPVKGQNVLIYLNTFENEIDYINSITKDQNGTKIFGMTFK